MIELKILLLGTPVIYWHDEVWKIKRRIPRSILYYLAIQHEPVGRSDLMAVFWPDEAPETARGFLRDNLSKLRTSLPDPGLLITDVDTICLDFHRVYTDFFEYTQILTRIVMQMWRVPKAQPLPPELYQECVRSAGLWRSPVIMAGVQLHNSLEYESWMTDLDRKLQRSRIMIMQRLVLHCSLLKDTGGVLLWGSLLADMDPYFEEYHLNVMNALLDTGSARQAYLYGEGIREKFFNDLGLEPSDLFLQTLEKAVQLSRKLT